MLDLAQCYMVPRVAAHPAAACFEVCDLHDAVVELDALVEPLINEYQAEQLAALEG